MSGLRPDQLPLDPLTLQVIAGTLSVVGGPGGSGSTRVQYFVTDGPATVGGLPYVDLAEAPASKESVQVQIYGGSPQLNEELTSALSLNADFAITVSNSMEENRLTWEAPLEMGDVLVSAGMVIMVSYSVGSSSSPPSPPPPSSASIPKVEYFVTDGVGTVDAVKYIDLANTPSDPSAVKVILVGGSYQLNAALVTPGSYEITLDNDSNLRRVNWDGFSMESALTDPGIYIAVEYYINQATATQASDILTSPFTGSLSGAVDVQEALNTIDSGSLGGGGVLSASDITTTAFTGSLSGAVDVQEALNTIDASDLGISTSWESDSGITHTLDQVAIGTDTPSAASALQVDSTTGTFVPPRMTTAQRNAISSPPEGSIVYDTDLSELVLRKSGSWVQMSLLGMPAGAIIMWTGGSCPAGFTRKTVLDARFPRGSATAGGTGGSSTHVHTIGSHTHTFTTGSSSGGMGVDTGPAGSAATSGHTHSGTTDPATGDTGSASTLPPYYDVLFCEKT